MVLPVIVAEHVLIALLTGSQNYQLQIVAAQLIHDALNQVKALLVRKTGDEWPTINVFSSTGRPNSC